MIWSSCGDAVVAGGERVAFGAGLLLGELVGVALAGVDEDREVRELGGAAAGDADPGPGLAGRARGLPEDPLAAALDAGEHELGAVLARAVEHQVDRDAAALAGADRDLLDDLGLSRPAVLGAVAVDLRGPRPAVARLEDELAVGQRQPDQERERRVGVGVGGDLEQGARDRGAVMRLAPARRAARAARRRSSAGRPGPCRRRRRADAGG